MVVEPKIQGILVLLVGKLRDEDIENDLTVDADRCLILDSCEEESLTLVRTYFFTCVGRMEYQGMLEVSELVRLTERRDDKRKRPKKKTQDRRGRRIQGVKMRATRKCITCLPITR